MRGVFSVTGWEDYTSWLRDDRHILKKINDLIKAIQTDPYQGIGKPEALKHDLNGYWSRRFNQEHRLVYRVQEDDILIYQCRYHY